MNNLCASLPRKIEFKNEPKSSVHQASCENWSGILRLLHHRADSQDVVSTGAKHQQRSRCKRQKNVIDTKKYSLKKDGFLAGESTVGWRGGIIWCGDGMCGWHPPHPTDLWPLWRRLAGDGPHYLNLPFAEGPLKWEKHMCALSWLLVPGHVGLNR